LERQVRQRISEALDRYAADEHGDVLRLTDVEPPEWRLRVGDWRVRFRLDFEARILYVLRVLPRDKAYR
jgi:mRNA interferase RelE/StbE